MVVCRENTSVGKTAHCVFDVESLASVWRWTTNENGLLRNGKGRCERDRVEVTFLSWKQPKWHWLRCSAGRCGLALGSRSTTGKEWESTIFLLMVCLLSVANLLDWPGLLPPCCEMWTRYRSRRRATAAARTTSETLGDHKWIGRLACVASFHWLTSSPTANKKAEKKV